MHMHYIEEIIKSNDNQKMINMKNIFEDLITFLKVSDAEKYEDVEWKLYEIVEGKKLTKQKAIEWVENMKPKSKWSLEDIEKVKTSKRVDIPLNDFYILMNMMYTDYNNVIEDDVDKYIEMSLDWYNDADTKLTGSEKLYYYYKNIVK